MKECLSNHNCMFLACRQSIAEEKEVVRTLLCSQLVNATSYQVVESSSLLIFFSLASGCVLQILAVFHAVILNMVLFW